MCASRKFLSRSRWTPRAHCVASSTSLVSDVLFAENMAEEETDYPAEAPMAAEVKEEAPTEDVKV